MSNVYKLSSTSGSALASALATSNAIQVSTTDGSVHINEAALRSAASAGLPADQAAAFVQQMLAYAQTGGVVLPTGGAQPAVVPWGAIGQVIQSGDVPAQWMAAAVGVTQVADAATIGAAFKAKFPQAPATLNNSAVMNQIATSTKGFAPDLRPHPRDVNWSDVAAQVQKLAAALGRASFGPWEGHLWGWAVGFQITFNHDDAATISSLLVGDGSVSLLESALAAGLKAGVAGAVSAFLGVISAAGSGALALIALGLGENMKLVNGPWGVSLECNWPYTGGFFFWAQSASAVPSVSLTAPDAASTVTGVTTLKANSTGVGGVAFSVNYSTGAGGVWHSLGNGNKMRVNGVTTLWNLDVDTRFIPNQTGVNLCALALNGDGTPGDMSLRDYRFVDVSNPAVVGPVIVVRAELQTHTTDDRDMNTNFSVQVISGDGRVMIADLNGANDSANGNAAYVAGSDHTIAIPVAGGPTQGMCFNWKVKIWQQTSGTKVDKTWKFDAKVTLYFSDHSTVSHTKNGIVLTGDGASVTFQ